MTVAPVSIFDLASTQARWLSARQAAVAGNIANANTAGFVGRDVVPFEKLVGETRVAMAATAPGHHGGMADVALRDTAQPKSLMPSGNTVVLEDELVKAGEVRRSMELNTAIVKAFHRMTIMSVRS
ncbi:MAG: flagellar basal body rod protein FlgB [Mesorhizobium amorphae]|nr:MAG: flagellar basal body rod protein FlgB [Mesorhizobium amorphae]